MEKARYEDIVEKVRPMLGHLQTPVPALPISEETDLVRDLGLDSLKVMELLFEVEDAFDISYPINSLGEVHTVRDLALQIKSEMELH